jgi:hypothetical protein
MPTIKRTQPAPQEILYSVCLAAWNLCSQQLENFTNLKAIYTPAFIADAVQGVQNAKALPQSRQTSAVRKEARINLANATRQVLANWQLLKVYITNAFAADLVNTKLEAAGASLYKKASADNWSSVRNLTDVANSFITNNLEDLMANDNMPATFQGTFLADGNECIGLSVFFAQVNLDKQAATSMKIDANNTIYNNVIKMLKDGQQIFKDDEVIKKQFVFSYLLSLYQGDGSASLKGYIVNNLGMPIQGVTIDSLDGKYSATTNKKGHYRIARIAEGSYTFNITCPGYNPMVQVITFAAGTASKGSFEMANQMKKVA